MANCNNTVDFIKEKERMCNSFEYCCNGCPLEKHHCDCLVNGNPEKAIEIVQKWSDENPEKTIMMDFFEKYPNAEKDEDGTPCVCPNYLGYKTKYSDNCSYFLCSKCAECWSTPLSEAIKTE